jgi:hypothetical protein
LGRPDVESEVKSTENCNMLNEIVKGEYVRKCKRNAMHRDEIMQKENWEKSKRNIMYRYVIKKTLEYGDGI